MEKSLHRRAGILIAVFGILFAALVARLYSVQITGHEESRSRAEAQSHGTVVVERPRGAIRDATGRYLALSAPVESVWADPSMIEDPKAVAKDLSNLLGIPADDLARRLLPRDRKFVWIKRSVEEGEAGEVRKMIAATGGRRPARPRVGVTTEHVRRYLQGPLMAHLLGFESRDPGHHEGIERMLDPYIAEVRRTVSVSVDARRRVVDAPEIREPGTEAILTIDLLLQKIVEEELDAACAEFQPRWAVAVVMDPRSGALLALANRPGFDPNSPGSSPASARRNRAVTDPYEPGSTLKPFLAAFALDRGLATPETRFDCELGLWKHGPRLLHDHHPYGMLSLRDVIVHSSNIGAAKLGAQTLGRSRIHECVRAFGFGERTGVDLPAEEGGTVLPLGKWTLYSDTSVPMGHEIAVTPLQLVTAMSAIANGGTLYRPWVIRRVATDDGTVLMERGPQAVRRVIGEGVSREMCGILAAVVAEGTGRKAAIPGVAVAGKTGTSQKVDPATGRYSHEKFTSSFVGFAPAEGARMCVAVIVDEPQGAYYGGTVAAPTAREIIRRGLVHMAN